MSVVEDVLVLMIVGLMGAVGWIVYDKHKTSKPMISSSLTQTTTTTTSQGLSLPNTRATEKGSITGSMNYPAGNLPPHLKVCVDSVNDKNVTNCLEKPLSGADSLAFKIDVDPGDYYLYEQQSASDTHGLTGNFGSSTFKAYYDQLSTCSNQEACKAITNPQPIKITVTVGKSSGIKDSTFDWGQ
jgi:hypothetical protein